MFKLQWDHIDFERCFIDIIVEQVGRGGATETEKAEIIRLG
jgi:hypothetical protein